MVLVLADIVLALHVAVVLFVTAGLLAILAGNWAGWQWVNRPRFRILHVLAIAVVVGESWLGIICPLTTLESWLRVQGGGVAHSQSFIAHWLQRLLFYSGPEWAFTLAYSLFGLLIAYTWWRFPPKR